MMGSFAASVAVNTMMANNAVMNGSKTRYQPDATQGLFIGFVVFLLSLFILGSIFCGFEYVTGLDGEYGMVASNNTEYVMSDTVVVNDVVFVESSVDDVIVVEVTEVLP